MSTDPLALPPMTRRELTDYSDDPEYTVSLYPSRPAPETDEPTSAQCMSRLLAGLED